MQESVGVRLAQLRKQLHTMEVYLDLKREARDWHGVMDAACDIREIEAEIRALEKYTGRDD